MQLDFALCERYLRMPLSHWRKAQNALDFICNDSVARLLFEHIQDAFFQEMNPQIAAQRCNHLMRYINVFAPQFHDAVFSAVFASSLSTLLGRLTMICHDSEIVADTLSDYKIWACAYEEETGREGIGSSDWMSILFSQKIFRIGRLQYECAIFQAPFYIFRIQKTGDCRLASEVEMKILETGEDAVVPGSERILRYHPVDVQTARISHGYQELKLSNAELLLAPGLPVLNVHIPQIGPLKKDLVDASLSKAARFFSEKNFPAQLAVCESWLLDPAILTYAHGSKNICAFQQRFCKFPLSSKVSDAVSRVYGKKYIGARAETLPIETGLQRGLRQYLLAGKRVANTGGFLLL